MVEIKFTQGSIFHDLKRGYVVQLETNSNIEPLQDLLTNDKLKVAEIKYHRKKRSLDANAALWHLIDKIAEVLRTSREFQYERFIKEYGQYRSVAVAPSAVEDLKRYDLARFYMVGKPKMIEGKKLVPLTMFVGSSKYNSKEMARLLDGVIEEAKELGIDFISKEEQSRLIEEWGK